jgi:hypothetical protein
LVEDKQLLKKTTRQPPANVVFGIAATETNIGLTVIETSALQEGIAAIKPAGEIVYYLLARPRNTAAGLMCTKAVRTTTTRTRLGESSFVARSLRFMAM